MPSTRPLPPHFMTIPQAGAHYFALGHNASYKAAERGDLVVVQVGNRLLVSVPAMERRLLEGWRRQPEEPMTGGEQKEVA
jgi:hypothetical protein